MECKNLEVMSSIIENGTKYIEEVTTMVIQSTTELLLKYTCKHRQFWNKHVYTIALICTVRFEHIEVLLLEIMSILNTMNSQDISPRKIWSGIVDEYSLLCLITKLVIPRTSEKYLKYTIIKLSKSRCNDINCVRRKVSSNTLRSITSLWSECTHRVKVLLELLFAFQTF